MTTTLLIAPLDEALTFARGPTGQTIGVLSYRDDQVTGVDLSALMLSAAEDAVDLVNRLGHDAVRAAIRSGEPIVTLPVSELDVPIRLTDAHIAVGTNYAEHAEESAVTGSPFLFPKLVTPTASRADIPTADGLVDFEAELCLVPMKPLGLTDPAGGGLILGNDVTDRAVLMRGVDLKNPQSGRGFTDGKSAPGYLPVGDLFVVPRDLNAFVAGLTLQLSVNGEERQRARVTEWIWDLIEILNQARAKRETVWSWREGEAHLAFTDDGAISARTLIMAGTPAGTIFQGVPGKDRRYGLLRWILSGFRGSVVPHVIAAYIARSQAQKAYLQPGDQVTIWVDRLGTLSNRVKACKAY